MHTSGWVVEVYFIIKSTKQTCNKKNKTVFTTHATMLGRALSGNNYNIYEMAANQELSKNFDSDKNAREIGVHTKFQSRKSSSNI